MSEAIIGLIGVIIGGLIVTVAQFITHFLNYRKWKKEIKIQHLRLRRDKLEQVFNKAKKEILDGMTKNSYDIDMISDLQFYFPKEVFQSFEKIITGKEEREFNKKMLFFLIIKEMKKSLAKIDEEIEEEIK